MNVISFSGNLGRDIELKQTAQGKSIGIFSVANTVGYKDNKTTNWFKCILFGKQAEALAPYLQKGKKVIVVGELKIAEYTSKEGVPKKSIEVVVDKIELIRDSSEKIEKKETTDTKQTYDDTLNDPIPF